MRRETFEKTKIAVAVEVAHGFWTTLGLIRIAQVADFSHRSLIPFVEQNVQRGSVMINDGWQAYNPLASHGFVHEVRDSGAVGTAPTPYCRLTAQPKPKPPQVGST